MMTRDEATTLTHLIHLIRRDWDEAGIMAALATARDRGDALDVAHAALYAAGDRANRTPAIIPLAGEHWMRGHALGTTSYRDERCAEPGHQSYPRHNCGLCRSEQLARRDDVPPPEPARRIDPDRRRELAAAARAAARIPVTLGIGGPDVGHVTAVDGDVVTMEITDPDTIAKISPPARPGSYSIDPAWSPTAGLPDDADEPTDPSLRRRLDGDVL